MVISRRSLIRGVGTLLAAPAIVRVASLMPVRRMMGDIEEIKALVDRRFAEALERAMKTCADVLFYGDAPIVPMAPGGHPKLRRALTARDREGITVGHG